MSKKRCTISGLLKLEDGSARLEMRAKLKKQRRKLGLLVAIPWKQIGEQLIDKIVEALDIELLELCLVAWKKREELREFADPEKYPPTKQNEVPLLEHEISSEQHVAVEVSLDHTRVSHKATLDLTVTLKLKGCLLTIKNGRIIKVTPGKCAAEANLSFKGITLAETKTEELSLGPAEDLGEGVPIEHILKLADHPHAMAA